MRIESIFPNMVSQRLSDLSFGMVKNYFKNFVKLKLGKDMVDPYFSVLFLTFRCNYACAFCDEGSGKHKYPEIPMDELNTEDMKKILKILRKRSPSIYFTGGEPYLREDIVELTRYAKELGFHPIYLNTNGSLIHTKPEVLDNIDNIVFSLHALDPEKYSKTIQRSTKMFDMVMENIEKAKSLMKEKNFDIGINCVVTPETLGDVEDVMEFCFERDLRFAIVPAIVKTKPQEGLNSEKYRQLINKVIAKKKEGRSVFNSYKYLEIIRSFEDFDCHPMLTPHIHPDGSLLYPCNLMVKSKINLLEIGDYDKAVEECRKKVGKLPACKSKCPLACYVEPSVMTKNPF